MPIPSRPVKGLREINQERRDREFLNKVQNHQFDDSRVEIAAEKLSGAVVINPAYAPGEVMRYGIKPNDESLRSQNSLAMAALLNPNVSGYTGKVVFLPVVGNDTYYFDDFFPSRADIFIEGNGCRIDFSKDQEPSDDSTAFIYAINNLEISNLEINVDYDGNGLDHAGNAIRFGQRNDSGVYFQIGFEETLARPLGWFVLRNVRVTTNNPVNDGAILMLGGVKNTIIDNLVIDGGAVNGVGGVSYGIITEFGYWSNNGSPSDDDDWSSSHQSEAIFRNIRIANLSRDYPEGAGISLIGAGYCIVENLRVNGAYHAFESRPGEALWYRVSPNDEAIRKQGIILRNICGINITNSGLVLIGAESAATGTLSAEIAALGHPADYIAQTKLMKFSVDGFRFPDADVGINVSGNCVIRNGYISNYSSSGAIRIAPETGFFIIENVDMFDGDGVAVEASTARVISGSSIQRRGRIANCKIGGANSVGIALNECDGVVIEDNEIGYATALGDLANESVMTQGINLAATAKHVCMRNNYIRVAGGGTAYVSASTAGIGDRGNNIIGPINDSTHTAGFFMFDDISRAQDTAIAARTNIINTYDKYLGKKVFDTTNNRILYALGSADNSGWAVCDGGGTVTPS